MARRSYINDMARRDSAGLPMLAPPRTLFRRFATTLPFVEAEPVPERRNISPQVWGTAQQTQPDQPSVKGTKAAPPRAPIDPPLKPKATPALAAPASITPPVVAAASTTREVAPPFGRKSSEHPSLNTLGRAPHDASKVPAFAGRNPMFATSESRSDSHPLRSPESHTQPVLIRAQSPARNSHTRSEELRPLPIVEMPPVRSISSQRSRPAGHIAPIALAPREPLPRPALPPSPSKDAAAPTLKIGSIEVRIVAAPVAPVAAPAKSLTAQKFTPLSRELTSAFGLRQG